jgi:hypothetical protein
MKHRGQDFSSSGPLANGLHRSEIEIRAFLKPCGACGQRTLLSSVRSCSLFAILLDMPNPLAYAVVSDPLPITSTA